METGDLVDIEQGGQWVRCRVMVPLGSGVGDVLAVFQRLSDYRRVIWYRSGREAVVA